MIQGKSVLAIIPARGGSKGVVRKNIRDVGGKPLIAWSIDEAKKSQYIDQVIVSSDDAEIIAVAEQWGGAVPFVRPAELAQDDSASIDVVLHALDLLPGFDIVVLLQTTSPLRTVNDIDGAIASCMGVNACVSVCAAEESPYWMFSVTETGEILPAMSGEEAFTQRQKLPPLYSLNGAVYVAKTEWLRQSRSFISKGTRAFLMPSERSLDIDTELDLKLLNFYLKEVVNGHS